MFLVLGSRMGAGYTIEDFFKSCILGRRVRGPSKRVVALLETTAEVLQKVMERRRA
jgi:hypothetical protein